MRRLAWIPLVLLAGAVILFAGFALRRDPHVAPAALVGRPVPAVQTAALAGGPARPIREALGQGPVLINFFASWCAPCAQEHPQLMALRARGVRIVGIMRGKGVPMQAEDDPRLDGTKQPAMALFFLDASDTLVEIIRRSDFVD